MNILVIEDEPTSRKLATLVLSSSGHKVVDAQSAEAAIEAVCRSQPEMILLDLALPGMDGLALARQLKGESKTRHIPIVAVTSYPERFPGRKLFGRVVMRTSSSPSTLEHSRTRSKPLRAKASQQNNYTQP